MTINLTKLEQTHLHKKVEPFNLDNKRNRRRVRIKKYKPETYFCYSNLFTYLHYNLPNKGREIILGTGGRGDSF